MFDAQQSREQSTLHPSRPCPCPGLTVLVGAGRPGGLISLVSRQQELKRESRERGCGKSRPNRNLVAMAKGGSSRAAGGW